MSKKKFLATLVFACLCLCSCKNAAKEMTATEMYEGALEDYSNKEFEKVLATCSRILNLDPDFFYADLLKAKAMFFLARHGDTKKLLSSLVKKHPEYTDARIWYARVLVLEDSLEKAQVVLDNELRINHTDWRVYYLYSLLAGKEQSYEVQLDMLSRAELMLREGKKVFAETARVWAALGVAEKTREHLMLYEILSSKNEEE